MTTLTASIIPGRFPRLRAIAAARLARRAGKTIGFLLLPLALLMSGCHGNHPLNTASGRPEVLITGASAKQILNTARTFFINRGYALTPSDNGNKLVFSRRSEKPGGAPSKSSCWRVRLLLVDLGNGSHRLSGTPTKVENCGGELEAEHAMGVAYPQIQSLLEEIKLEATLAR